MNKAYMIDNPNENSPKELSPCVSDCRLDNNDICLGCNRTIAEIVGWRDKSENQKREILVNCIRRQKTAVR